MDLDVRDLARVEVRADCLLILEPVEHHDREHVVVFDELLGFVLADLRLRLRVLDDDLHLAAGDAVAGVEIAPVGVDALVELHGNGRRARDRQQVPDLDLRGRDAGRRSRTRLTRRSPTTCPGRKPTCGVP